MRWYVIVESGTERILGVAQASDPLAACIQVSRRTQDRASRVLFEIRSDPRPGDWTVYELPEQFDEPRAWEMFGLDVISHGQRTAIVACRKQT